MIIHEGYDNLNLTNPVVTLGIFDGVHLGHKALLDFLVTRAAEANGESVVVTFSPHPKLVLDPNRINLSFLTSIEEKKVLLGEAGIGHLIIIEFNTGFSNISACDFVNHVLVNKIGTKHLIVGYNHHFGKHGEGNFNTIKRCTETLDFKVEQVQAFNSGEGVVSSSLIRDSLLNGRLDEANRRLGYTYTIKGTIVKGDQIGRAIGFPTANIIPDFQYKLIPSSGVYAVKVKVDEVLYGGMLSIGSNPTVNSDGSRRTIEVNIFDFDNDIYGKSISVFFRKRMRDMVKFEDTLQLAEQMMLDKQQAMRLLG
jgi:riboflavin kinase/FMN adenylyltransferase